MRSRAFALALIVSASACGGQKTTSTTPVASASASASAPVVVQQSGDAGVAQIDPAAVRTVIRGATARFMICYVAGLKKDKKLAGRVETKFVIDETGHVISAEDVTRSNVLQDDATRDCIVSKFKQLEFPPPQPSGKVPITYPLLLDPSMVTVETPDAGVAATTDEYGHERKPFNPGAVAAALGKTDIKSCGFHGAGHIRLTFDPSGVVTKTEIDAPANIDKTPAGVCIAKAFSAARVPAFDGNAATIGKSFNVP
ncbi:MAG TPA: AgmX/PglI C-terminal domain-containing protein [Polyangiaceae bacterium]|jgi:hypothetical protein|nr:AgmX/PglI C-terminal domain-containing protein [Polyangiaceae bacterium]